MDDFWGTEAWEQWSSEIGRVLPPAEFPIMDVPLTDPLLRSLFTVTEIPQITNIQFWRGTEGRNTSERGEDSREAHLRAIRDHRGRIMVLMTHNTDVADSWEREGEDPGILLPVLTEWIRARRRCVAACDDSLAGELVADSW